MELLPRLSAERNLLGTDDCDAPLNRVAADEGNAALKTRNQVPSNQQVQQASSECGADKKRLEFQQALEVRFGPPSLASARNSTDRTSFPPAARPIHDGSDEHIGSFPPKACEERQKGETGGTQQDNDILDDDVTRTLVVAGAWGPGRHGLPPYAAIRGEVWGSFEFSVDPSPHSRLFTFEPSKGTVYHGSKQMIRVLFSPQNPTPTEERIRSVLSHIPPGALKTQEVTATARLYYRGAPGTSYSQGQEVAMIRLIAPFSGAL
ncbi:hypothetical protein, conserved [Eimeria necatrix]|uniref:Uncharacterized protein n=1 Tax=Eimeria necatrix TaxID=51315 RepID=U6MJK1_9EIME|nr:hypothetical protein, conserved [Eimeria necatrix]CDJ64191.1 hypothetical protein, conserved [Eimeria necatrix]